MTVALIHRDDYDKPVENAIRICDGFHKLKADSKVLIKPNLVIGGRKGLIPNSNAILGTDVVSVQDINEEWFLGAHITIAF